MASPLRFFRKNQKALMVIFGAMLMVSFLVVGSVQQFADPGRQEEYENPVLATWDQGEITLDDLRQLEYDRNYARQFAQTLMSMAYENKGQPKVQPFNTRTDPYSLQELMFLSRWARDMKIEVTDAAITDYLAKLSDDTVVDQQEMKNILRGGNFRNTRLTLDRLYDAMRRELLAAAAYKILSGPFFPLSPYVASASPSEAWDYYQRLHRQVDLDLIPYHAEDYANKVPVPSEKELQAFFNKYKYDYPHPDSPEPGFKRRRKLAFEWIKFDFAKLQDELQTQFLEEEKKKVTDKEIADYYQRNKETFKKLEPAKLPDEEKQETPEVKPDETKTDENKQDDSKAKDKPASKPAPKGDKPSAKLHRNPGRRAIGDAPYNVALTQQQKQPASEKKSEQKEAAPAQPEEEKKTPAEGSAKEKEGKKAQKQEPATNEEKVEYKPLEEVKDEIRDKIAREKARQRAADESREKLDKAMRQIRKTLKTYSRDYRKHQDGEIAEKPTPPDFEELAEEHGLTAGANEKPLDILDFRKSELGQAERRSFDQQYFQLTRQFRVESFAEIAFSQDNASAPLYSPREFQAGFSMSAETRAEVEYLYWKTADEEAVVPKFEDVRNHVEEVWKLQKGFQLAQKAATKDLETAGESGEPLAEALPKRKTKLFRTMPFTWMTRGGTPLAASGSPTMSTVYRADEKGALEEIGYEFMKGVYDTRTGELTTAPNQNHTIVYLAKVASQTPDEKTLREGFLESRWTNDLQAIAASDLGRVLQKTYDQLRTKWDFQWVEDPAAHFN